MGRRRGGGGENWEGGVGGVGEVLEGMGEEEYWGSGRWERGVVVSGARNRRSGRSAVRGVGGVQ